MYNEPGIYFNKPSQRGTGNINLEPVVIVLAVIMAIVIGFFLWERMKREQRLKEQGDALSKAVGERIDGTIRVFGELQKGLGELTEKTKNIEEVGKSISSLQEIIQVPKPRGGLGELLLERLLADSLPRDFYDLQYRFRSGEIVDAVVRVGGNLVPIDAKFPLEEFERMVAAESEKEQAGGHPKHCVPDGKRIGQGQACHHG